MTPTWILIISEYEFAWWKRIGQSTVIGGLKGEVLVFHPPEDCPCSARYVYVPDEVFSQGHESVDEFLSQEMSELRQYVKERKAVAETVAEILLGENIDWSLDDGNQDSQYGVPADIDAWHLWLEKGRGKVFKAAPLPPSAFIDAYHFWDFVYAGGDCYEMEPFEESSLTDDQALKMLLALEVTISENGMCWFYRALRDRFGFPWGYSEQYECDMYQLNVEFIRLIVKQHKGKQAQLLLTDESGQ